MLHVKSVEVTEGTLTIATCLQPLASVTVTLYEPPARFDMVAVVPPLLQAYVYAGVPPVALTVALPMAKHVALTAEVVKTMAVGWVKVTDLTPKQPAASVTVMV